MIDDYMCEPTTNSSISDRTASPIDDHQISIRYWERGRLIAAARVCFILGMTVMIISLVLRFTMEGGIPSGWALSLTFAEMSLIPAIITFAVYLFASKQVRFLTAYHILAKKKQLRSSAVYEEMDTSFFYDKTVTSCSSFKNVDSDFSSESFLKKNTSSTREEDEENEEEISSDYFFDNYTSADNVEGAGTSSSSSTDKKGISSKEDEQMDLEADSRRTISPPPMMLETKKHVSIQLDIKVPKYSSLDVFVTCYKESNEIIQETLAGAMAMVPPEWLSHSKVHLLDDGAKDCRQAMCELMGVNYIRRPNLGEGAKGGNLNYALSITSGSLLFILDADMVPTSGALVHLCECMEHADESVAFVQSAQRFKDVRKCDLYGSRNTLFMERCQSLNGSVGWCGFVGTSAILRRDAVEDVGCFSTAFVTEDFCLTAELHVKGYRSIFTPYVVAVGTSPQNLQELITQRSRWHWGNLQVLYHHRRSLFNTNFPVEFRMGLLNMYVNAVSLPFVLGLLVLFALAVIFDGDIVPDPAIIRSLYLYFFLLKGSQYFFVDAHATKQERMLFITDSVSTNEYYSGVLLPVLSLYLNIKYLLTFGRDIKFKSMGGVGEVTTDMILVVAVILGLALFFLASSIVGFSRVISTGKDPIEDGFLSLFVLTESVRFLIGGIHLLRPFPVTSVPPSLPSLGGEEQGGGEEAGVGLQASKTRWFCLVLAVPIIQSTMLALAVVGSILEACGVLPRLLSN